MDKIKFFSRTSKPETLPTPPGEIFEPEYSLVIDDNGKETLEVSGKRNVFEYIQQGKDDCDVYNIIDRYNKGDLGVLNKVQGMYGDFTNSPKSLMEAYGLVKNVENMFMELPLEVRKKFNYDPKEFVASLNNGKFEEVKSEVAPEDVSDVGGDSNE